MVRLRGSRRQKNCAQHQNRGKFVLQEPPLSRHFREVYHSGTHGQFREAPQGVKSLRVSGRALAPFDGAFAGAATSKKCVTLWVYLFFVFNELRVKLLCTVCHLFGDGRRAIGVWRRAQNPGRANNSFVLAVLTRSQRGVRKSTDTFGHAAGVTSVPAGVLCHSNQNADQEIGALEVRAAHSVVKEQYAARPEQRGTDAPSSGAKENPD
jgi:hypothetical protein